MGAEVHPYARQQEDPRSEQRGDQLLCLLKDTDGWIKRRMFLHDEITGREEDLSVESKIFTLYNNTSNDYKNARHIRTLTYPSL